MKKLLTLLFTLCITLIGYRSVFAIDTYSAGFDKMRVVYENLQGTPTNADFTCIGNRCSSNRFNSYNSLTSLFLYLSPTQSFSGYNHLNFNDSITIYSYTNLNVSSFQPVTPDSISVVALHYGNLLSRAGVCSLNNTVISDTNKLVGQMTDANGNTLNVYSTTFNVSVDCLVNGNSFSSGTDTMVLEFNIDTGFQPSLTGEVSVDVVHNYYFIAYHSEYEANLNDIINAIQNITLNGANITVDQSQTTDAIEDQTEQIINNQNDNTQQIVDQLTDESCSQVQCNNLNHYTVGPNYRNSNINYTWVNGVLSSFPYTSSGATSSSVDMTHAQANNISPGFTRGQTFVVVFSHPIDWNVTITNNCVMTAGNTYLECSATSSINSIGFLLSVNPGDNVTIDNLGVYVSLKDNYNGQYCEYGSTTDICTGSNKLDNISNSIDDVNDTLNNSDTSEADSDMSDMINNFNQSDYGFSDFVLLPITAIRSVNSATCSPLHLVIPYVNQPLDLPCFTPIYESNFSQVYNIIKVVITGVVGYYCCLSIFKTVQAVLNPNDDNISTFDL